MGKNNGYGQLGTGMVIMLNHIAIRIPFSVLLSCTALGLDGIWITLLFSFVASVCDGAVTICRKDIIKTGMYLHIRLYPSEATKDEWIHEAKRKIKKELEQKYENIEIVFCK